MVDVQPVLGGNGADTVQLLGRDLARQQRHDMPRLALTGDPLLVVGFGNGREAHLLVMLVGGEQHVLEHPGGGFGGGNLDQNAERQGVVDHGLADVENVHPILRQHAGDGGGQARTVLAGDVDQDDIAQGAAPLAN